MIFTDNRFKVILADPPWTYTDKLRSKGMRGQGAEAHYACLSKAELKAIPVAQKLAAPDCALFLWATGPQLKVAIEVMEAWQFRYKTVAFVWEKQNLRFPTPFFGLGRWTRSCYEYVLLGTRGKPKRINAGVAQWIKAPRTKHSAKPEEAQDAIERLMGDVPRLELFARRNRRCWVCTGLDLDGFDIREL